MEVAKHADEASNKDWRRVGREVGRLGLGLFFFVLWLCCLFFTSTGEHGFLYVSVFHQVQYEKHATGQPICKNTIP